jgi:hypothetical protein
VASNSGALLVIVGVAIALAAVLMRPVGPVAEGPREILRRRFARGEINA